MANILPKGTEIRCPRKRHLVGVTNQDLHVGQVFRFKMIDFEAGQERIAGEPCKCKLCGSAYFMQNTIHTVNGWNPSDPQLEPVARKR